MINPGSQPMRPPVRRGLNSIPQSIMILNRAVMELQRTENDYNGHRQSALDACNKALDELKGLAKEANLPMPGARPFMPPAQRPMPPGGTPPPGAPQQPSGAPVPPPAPGTPNQ